MRVLSWLRIRLRVWVQVFVGELLAATKPTTDLRRSYHRGMKAARERPLFVRRK